MGLNKKIVTIMGAGNGGHAVAAYLSLCGFSVNLYEHPNFSSNFLKVLATREIYTEGIFGENKIVLNRATTDLREAIADTEIIFVVTPAFAHKPMAEVLSCYIQKGQIVVLMPGSGGSLEFARILKGKTNVNSEVILAETSTLPFGTRLKSPGTVAIFIKAKLLPVGIFPSKYTQEVVNRLLEFFPDLIPTQDVLEAAINNPNSILHPPAVLLSATHIEHAKGDYYLYAEGMTPSLARILEVLNSERLALCKALGYQLYHCNNIDFNSVCLGETEEECRDRILTTTMDAFFGKGSIKGGLAMRGPFSLQDRYITEDVPFGMVLLATLGRQVGVPMPIHEALINLASIINRTDYWETGRGMKQLGLAGLSPEQIKVFLWEGKLKKD